MYFQRFFIEITKTNPPHPVFQLECFQKMGHIPKKTSQTVQNFRHRLKAFGRLPHILQRRKRK